MHEILYCWAKNKTTSGKELSKLFKMLTEAAVSWIHK